MRLPSKKENQFCIHENYLDFKNLKDSELLCDVLNIDRSFTPWVSKNLLNKFSGLRGLRKAKYQDVIGVDGIKKNQAQTLMACIELGWRLVHSPLNLGQTYENSFQVFRAYRALLGREEVEVVWLLLLDARLRKMECLEVFRGSLTGSILHPREILRLVLLKNAVAFILLHNHPSGDPKPSPEDQRITKGIKRAANLLQIDFLDHLIITEGSFYSFSDHGQIK